MKKRAFCLMHAMLVGVAVFAQQPLIAKAPPLVMLNPLTPDEAGIVGAAYDKLLAEAGDIRIINKLVLDKGMRDYRFQPRDWTNAEKTIALCEALAIDWVVRPQLQKRADDGEIIISAVLLNVQTRQIMCSTPVALQNANEAPHKAPALIDGIIRMINGGSEGITASNQSSEAYRRGDRGPAGGYVYYDKGGYSEGWRYLEVAPQAFEALVPRGRYIEKAPGTGNDIGAGKKNTGLILQMNGDEQIIKAARICANLELNLFRDWFLPSHGELRHLSTIPLPDFGGPNLGGFSIGYYWSSSGSEDSVMFSKPGERMPDRNQPNYYVRAIRAF